MRFLFWLRRFLFGHRARVYARILGGGNGAERSWGRRMSCFRQRRPPGRVTTGSGSRRRRRHVCERAAYRPAFAALEPRVLLTHNVGSLDDTYAYTAPATADVLEIDVTAEGYGRITAKAGGSTLQTDTFTHYKAVEIDATGGVAADTVKLLGSLATVATGGLEALTIKTGSGADTIDFSALAAADRFVKVTIDAGADADTFKAPNGTNTFDVTGAGAGAVESIAFSGVESIVAGTGDDQFFLGPTAAIAIDGGGGSGTDTLFGPDIAAGVNWRITGAGAGDATAVGSGAPAITFAAVENIVGGQSADTFAIGAAGSLAGTLDGGVVIDDTKIDALDLSARTAAATVSLGDGTVKEGGTTVAKFQRIRSVTGGAAAGDVLVGPDGAGTAVAWVLSGANGGTVRGIPFAGFENLTGGDTSADTFTFERGSSLSGTVTGGSGTGDGVFVATASGGLDYTVLDPAAKPSPATVNGITIRHVGIDPVTVLSGDGTNQTLDGTAGADVITLSPGAAAGQTKVEFQRRFRVSGVWSTGSVWKTETFANPTGSLTVRGKAGEDVLVVKGLGSGFSAGLNLYGYESNGSADGFRSENDEVRFEAETLTGGGAIDVFADRIVVTAGTKVSSLVADGTSFASTAVRGENWSAWRATVGGQITFRARESGTPELDNLIPWPYFTRDVGIDIGAAAEIRGGRIEMTAEAEEVKLKDRLKTGGLARELVSFAADALKAFVDLPLKVLVKKATSTVTVGAGAKLLAASDVRIVALASADSTASAASEIVSVGVSWAESSATVSVGTNATIKAGGTLDVFADGTAIAAMASETAREEPNPALGALEKFSGSVAVADARLTAHATVAAGATIYGGRTVNVRAFGVIESEAEADAQMMADGTAAVGAAIQLSRADVLTRIGGTVVGDLATAGGDATNLEFDPMRPAADYDSDASGNVIVHRAQDGWIASTVRLKSEVPKRAGVASDKAMPAGTILRYVGPVDADGKKTIALVGQNFRDTTTWEVSSEPIGFVDFDNDRIAIFDSGAGSGRVYNNFTGLTGDPVEYSPRRGAHIGGLNPGEYYIIRQSDNPDTVVDESRYIKLARSRQLARDGVAINLTNRNAGVQVSTNTREFSATDVQGDSIYFPGIGNTFMVGQPVLYREQGRGSKDRVIEKTGGAVVWQSTDPALDGTPYVPTIAGLRHGTVYYVKTAIDEFNLDGDQRLVSGQRIQLANLENDAVAGLAIPLGTVDTAGATARPAISAVDAAADTLGLTGHGFPGDTVVTYSPGTATSIGGLEANRQNRVVVVDADTVALGASFTGANVDVDADTITFAAPHFLKNGDAVSYRATVPVGGLASGTIYYVRVIDETTIKLTATKSAALYPNQARVQFDKERLDGTTFRVVNSFTEGQAVTFRTTDAATVAGLSSGRTYYVTNRTATTFQLAEESGGVALVGLVVSGATLGSVFTVGSEGIDFTSAGAAAATHQLRLDLAAITPSALAGGRHQLRGQAASNFSLTALHVIDTGQSPVGATASLDATATASAASAASDYQPEEEPDGFLGKVASGKDFLDKYSNAFKVGFDTWSQPYKDNADKGGAKSKSSIQAAGSIAFSFTDHDVQAIVEKTAKMAATDDLEVTAEISQAIQLQAESETEPQNDAEGNPSGTAAKNSVSAAIVVGVENNSARAIVEEGAALDSLRALRVIGKVSYPFLTRPDEFVPTSVAELADRFKDFETAQDTIATYTDGTLGIKSGLVNTWAAATASGEDVGLAGSINVVTFKNVAEAVVKAGARLNQDSYYRPAGSVPGVTEVSTHESNDGNQTVSVEAYNQMQWLDVTGVFGFPTFEWSLADISKKRAPQVGAEPGSQGGKGGVGGSVFVHVLDNTTHAVIEEGALVHSGADRGFNLKAEEAIFKGSFTQAGASAGTVGVAGSFAYFEQDSDTLAKVAERTKIDGGRVDVYAGSLETQINFVGGITSSKSLGVGAGVAINDTDRTTRAIVGEANPVRTGALDATKAATIDVAGGVVVRANSSGGTFAFAVAGAKANAKADPPAAADPADDTDPLDGVSLPALFEDPQSGESGSPDSANKSRTGVGLAAAVSVIRLTDVTQASLANAKVTADALDVKAIDRSLLVTATGGGALAQTDESKSAVGLAGGFSWNEVSTTTDAVVRDATISLRSDTASTKLVNSPSDKRLSVTADNATRIVAVAAGLAGATSGGGATPGSGSSTAVSLAGSVALNTVTGATRARLADSTVAFTGSAARSDVRVRATDGSSVITVAGGVSLSIARSNTSGSTSVAAGAAIAVNRLTTTTSATVEGVTATSWSDNGTGGFTVLAESTGEIKAFTVAGSGTMASGSTGSGVAGSGAGSGSVNKILVDTTATVRGSMITVPGAAEVRARDTSEILAVAGAVAVSIGQSASGTAAVGGFGASFAVTQIGRAGDENLVAADVENSTLTAGGSITVAAESAATIFSLAIGAVGGVAGSGSGTAVAGSLAGSISINETRKTTRARAKGSTLRTTGTAAGLSVTATNDSTIDAVAGSAALQGAKSGGGTSVGVGLGFSLTINDIADTALARVEDTLVDVTGAAGVKASQAEARIKALSFGVAVSASVSAGGTAVAAGGTGAVALNEIANTVEASVAGTSAATRRNFSADGAITVEASSSAEIDATAVAAAASIAVSGGGAAPSVAIGVAVADNRIEGSIEASITNVPQVLAGGAITVEAKNSAAIDADVIAATAAISGSGSTGVGVSGGAAAATNTILTATTAAVDSSVLGTSAEKVGVVTVKATSDGSIDATVGAVAVAASLGATTGVGAAIGVSVARNFIGQDPRGSVASTTYRSSQSGITTLTQGQTVRVVGGGLGGDVYEYIGPTLSDSDPNRGGNQTFDLRSQEYRDTRLWRQVNVVDDRSATQAEILDSTVISSGAVTVAAESKGSIDATVFAVTLGVGGGGTTGVGAALSGVYVENLVAADMHAVVEKTAAGSFAIDAASLAVTAADTAAITARGTAAAISAAFGGTAGVAISVGVSLARSTVANDVAASIDGMTVTTSGDVSVAASADARIRSTTAAAAVAAAFGGTAGVALAGAGADATNVVLTKVNAAIEGATITSGRDVLVTASAQPKTLLTFSSALLTPGGLDGLAGEDPLREAAAGTIALRSQFTSAGIGLASALPLATYGPLALQTLVAGRTWKLTDGRDVYLLTRNAAGTVDVSRPMIDASVTGSAVSLAGGGTAGVGLAVGAALSRNLVGWTAGDTRSPIEVRARVVNSAIDAARDVKVTATDRLSIDATTYAMAAAVAGGGVAGVGGAGAGASAVNRIAATVEASITESGASRQVRAGSIALAAADSSVITSWTGATAIGAAFGGTAGVAVSVGVGLAENAIDTSVTAAVDGATVRTTGGSLAVTAARTAAIDASAMAAAVAIGGGGIAGVGVSGAGARADNAITGGVEARVKNAAVTAAGAVNVAASDASVIDATVRSLSVAAGGGTVGVGVAVGASVATNTIGSSAAARSSVTAQIVDSAVTATGDLDVTATATRTIDATVRSFAMGIAGGLVGGAGAGAGSSGTNTIYGGVRALIDDAPAGSRTVAARSVDVTATDTSTITATAGAAGIAASFGAVSGSVAIGVGLAKNTIDSQVSAAIEDARVTSTVGDVVVSATGAATIDATATAAAVSASGAGLAGLSFSGAGAEANNIIQPSVKATISGGSVTGAADVAVRAALAGTIDATVDSGSTAISGAGLAAGAAAIGASLATNTIGTSSARAEVLATVSGAAVQSADDVTVAATNTATVDATVEAASAALAIGGFLAGAAAGAGSDARNSIVARVAATVTGGTVAAADVVSITAADTSTISAEALAAAVAGAASFAPIGGSIAVSVGVSIARNTIDAQVAASMAGGAQVTKAAVLEVKADETATITGSSTAASVAAASGALSYAAAGGGAESTNTITTDARATITGSTVTMPGDVAVTATVVPTATTTVGSVTAAAGLVSLAAGGSVARVTINPVVDASITGSTVTADDVDVRATVTPRGQALAYGFNAGSAAVGVSLSAIDVAPQITATVGGTITAASLDVAATSSRPASAPTAAARSTGAAGGLLIGIDATRSTVGHGGSVSAGIASGANLTVSGATTVAAATSGRHTATADSVAGGIVAVGVSSSRADSTATATATVGANATITGGSLAVSATRDHDQFADNFAGGGGVAAGASATAVTGQSGAVTVTVGDGARVTLGGAFDVDAISTATLNGRVRAVSGGLLAGAGAEVRNGVTSAVTAAFGTDARVTARAVTVNAGNVLEKPSLGNENIKGGTGGLISGASASSVTTVSFDTKVDVAAAARLTVTGTEATAGEFAVRADNRIRAVDTVAFTTGGALSGARAESVVRTTQDKATVTIGDGARLTSVGDVAMSARGGGSVSTATNVETYGVATVAIADSQSEIRPVNLVTIGANARIDAVGNVLVSAGTDTNFNRDDYSLKARTDSFAGSAIPIDDVDSDARLISDNRIVVSGGAVVESAKDIKLHAERFGFGTMESKAKAVNWASAAASGINSALGGSEQYAGDVLVEATGVVTVDGTLRTGTKRIRELVLGTPAPAGGNPGGWDVAAGRVTTISNPSGLDVTTGAQLLQSGLIQELRSAQQNRLVYLGTNPTMVAFYDSEIARITAELLSQGLATVQQVYNWTSGSGTRTVFVGDVVRVNAGYGGGGTPGRFYGFKGPRGSIDLGAQNYGDAAKWELLSDSAVNQVVPVEKFVMTVTVGQSTAQAGIIDIRADAFVGGGAVEAPRDARITITNHTPAQLVIDGLTIPEQVGGVFLNGDSVLTNSAVNALNLDGLKNASFAPLAPATAVEVGAAGPAITLTNTFDGDLWTGAGTYGSPDLVVAGDITNYSGKVVLATEGSTVIRGSIRSGSVSIVAGDSVVVQGVSVYGMGGDPYGKLKALGNGIDPYNTAAAVSLLTAAASTPSVLASTITVDAEYINLNGLIQSGKESYALTIPAAIDAEIAGIRGNGQSNRLTRLSISNTDFKVFYDRIDDKIVIREVRSSGGNVQLTGNLLSTGSGKIKVLDGYASISIDNQTSRDIAIERVDVSQRGAGTLLLADKAKAPASATYSSGDGSRAVVKDSTTVRLAAGYGGGGTPGAVYKFVGTSTTLNLGGEDYRNRDRWVQVPLATLYSRTTPGALTPVDGTYTPAANWRYGFSVGMQTAERTTTTYGSSAWLGIDALAADPDNVREGPTVEILSQPKLLPAGTYFYKSGSADGDYVYDTQVRNMEEPKRFLVRKWDTSTWYGKKTYYEKWTEEKKQETVSTHTFRADRTVDIDFIGATAGTVAITSNAGGRILVNGPILNPSGTTTLTASAGIVQTNSGASVGGRAVVLSAASGVIQNVVTNIDDTAGTSLAATAAGAITIAEMSGGLPIDVVESTGRGTVTLSARTGMTRAAGATAAAAVKGGSISLTVAAGGVGAAGAALPIDQGDQGTHVVDVTATGGIHLRETAGNLAVRMIHSTNGEVSITVAAGSLIDGNRVETRDERSREQLLNTVWGSLQLTAGTGAQAKIDQTIADFAASKQTDYRQYWKWRNTTTDPSVYDAGVRIHLTAEEDAAYRDYYAGQGKTPAEIDAAIETLENSRTQQYRTLHGEFTAYDRGGYAAGDLTASFVVDFEYVLSAEQDAALRSGFKVWTEEELLYMVGGGLLKEVTDTQITIEDDNIQGTNVTIVTSGAGGGLGSFSAPVTIDLSRKLTQDERVILAAAERADVTFISGRKFAGAVTFAASAGGDTLTRATGAWADDGFAAGKYVRIEGRTSNATPDRTVWRIKGVAGAVLTLDRTNLAIAESGRTVTVTPVVLDPMAAGATPNFIEVAQRDDIDLTASGALDVTAAGAAFVGSESDLAIVRFKAGGDATVKTAGKITSAAASAATVVVSGVNLVLEAAEGGIGTSALPLRIDAGVSGMLTARAKETVHLTEDAGDMRVETIYSQQGDAVLVTRAGSILDAIGSDLTDVKATSLFLTAGGTGTIGTAADLLDVDQGTAGTLTASAAGVFVHEVAGNMRVADVVGRTGDVILEAQLSIVDADPQPETVAADVSGGSITLTALLGGVGNAGEELEIDSRATGSGRVKITAGLLNVYLNELNGDLHLDTIGTGPTATSFVSALAGKIVDDRIDPATFNIVSGKVYLFAAQDIGAVDKPITTKIANVEGKSTTGSTYIDNTGALVVGGVTGGPKGIEAGGEVRLTAHSPVEVTTSITAPNDIIVLALENPTSDGDDITVTATGSLRSTGGKVVLRAGDDVSLAVGSKIAALTTIEIRSGFADADTRGSTITLAGEVEAKLIDVRSTAYADTIAITDDAAVKGTLVAVGLGGKDTITNSSDASLTTAVGGIVFLVGDDAEITLHPTTLVPTRVASKPGTGDDDELVNSGGFAVLVGGAGADVLTNGVGAAIILGDEGAVDLAGAVVTSVESTGTAGGADTIAAGAGTAVIIAGRAADAITAGDGTNTILGDDGKATFDATGALTLAESTSPTVGAADTFTLGKGMYRVIAGAGAETIALGEGTNFVIGDAGRITVGATTTTMESIEPGTGANDSITLGAGTNAVIGGSGADTVRVLAGGSAGVGIVLGDNGSFTFDNATGRVKEIVGLIGDVNGAADTVDLQNGVNTVITGRGKDSITAGAGTNTVLSDTGRATFAADGTLTLAESTESGTGDADTITLGDGTNVVIAGAAADAITAGDGTSTILGDEGRATFDATGGLQLAESLNPSVGAADTFALGKGTYRVIAGAGAETLALGPGTNYLIGDAGRITVGATETTMESIEPGTGANDTITLGAGMNAVIGGSGADTIRVAGSTAGVGIVLGDNGSFTFDNATGRVKEITGLVGDVNGAADVVELQNGVNTVITGRGKDAITAGGGTNTVLSDMGRATFFPDGTLRVAESIESGVGDDDTITLQSGTNVVIAGAGADRVTTQNGTNFVLGDEGRIEVFTTGSKAGTTEVASTNGTIGGVDTINIGSGANVVIGGAAGDSITSSGTLAGARAVVLGDNGNLVLSNAGVLLTAESTDYAAGGADTVILESGTNTVIGGAAGDRITARNGQNTILGDDGKAEFFTSGPNLGRVKTIESTNPGSGGQDVITLANGTNTVIAGAEADTVSIGAGTAVVLGDEGRLVIATDIAGVVTGRTIETRNDSVGGNDRISATGASSTVMGGAGSDTITGTQPRNAAPPVFLVLGDAGRAEFDAAGQLSMVTTTSPGTGAADTVRTAGGADIIFGGDAGDDISAGDGKNLVVGDDGTVTFHAGPGRRVATIESRDTGGSGGVDTITAGLADDLVIGGVGGDTINAGAGDNVVAGDGGKVTYSAAGLLMTIESIELALGGADTITTLAGNDLLIGGTGGDIIDAGAGTNIVLGDHARVTLTVPGQIAEVTSIETAAGGNDTIRAAAGNDLVIGGFGADTITSTGGRDVVLGDSGRATFAANGEIMLAVSLADEVGQADTIATGAGADVVIGAAGGDTINAGAGGNVVLGDAGQVTWTPTPAVRPTRVIYWVPTGVVTVAQTATAAAGAGDTITTAVGDDVILAGDGADQVMAGDGRNYVVGDHGRVTFHAAPVGRPARVETTLPGTGGLDRITSGTGNDLVLGGAAGDEIAAGDGDNAVVGDHGYATYAAAGTFLVLEATNVTFGGADTITTMAGNDLVIAGTAGDTVDLGAGANIAFGDHAQVTFAAAGQYAVARSVETHAGGADVIRAGLGSDLVIGGAGGDTISSTGGRDVFVGDGGRATFALNGEITLVESVDEGTGGNDTLTASGGNCIMIGGAGVDSITAGAASIIFQDGGIVIWTPTRATRPGRLLAWAATGVRRSP